jgi:hypothetical protein
MYRQWFLFFVGCFRDTESRSVSNTSRHWLSLEQSYDLVLHHRATATYILSIDTTEHSSVEKSMYTLQQFDIT